MTSHGVGTGRGKTPSKTRNVPAPGGRTNLDEDMSKLSIINSDPVLPPKTDNGTGANVSKTIRVETNMYPLELDPDVQIFRYDVGISENFGNNRRQKEMAGGGANDFMYGHKREVCYNVFKTLVESDPEIFGSFVAFAYDKAKILYSRHELDEQLIQEPFIVQLSPKLREQLKIVSSVQSFEVRFQRNTKKFQYSLNDFVSVLNLNMDEFDRSPLQLMDIITAQAIYLNPNYWSFGNNHYKQTPVHLGPRDKAELGHDRELSDGITQTVRVVEGNDKDNSNIVMTIDVKSSVFWKEQPLLEIVSLQMGKNATNVAKLRHDQWNRLNFILNGLSVRTTYAMKRIVQVSGLTALQDTVETLSVETESGKVSIREYFDQKYNIKLRYLNLPCVKERNANKGTFNYYPLELCILCGGQRVELEKQNDTQMRVVAKKSVLKPYERWQEIINRGDEVGIFENDFLETFGIAVAYEPVVVDGQRQSIRVTANGNWNQKNAKFYLPKSLNNWVVVVMLNDDGGEPITQANAQSFANFYVEQARKFGMQVKPPQLLLWASDETAIESLGNKCVERNVEFVLFLTEMKNKKGQFIHDKFKQYFEEDCDILTQNLVNERTVYPILNKDRGWDNLIQNILFKTNAKLGGLNYYVNVPVLNDPELMILSYDLSHHTNQKMYCDGEIYVPTSVGLCSNSGPHPLLLTGNYGFQNMRQEEAGDILTHLTIGELEKWRKHHNGRFPTKLLVFRDGVSEGQYAMVLTKELPRLHEAFNKMGSRLPKTEVFAVEKRHNARFKPETVNPNDRASDQNIPPLTAISNGAVHPTREEIYFCTHLTIQGTAKVPRYDKLFDGIGLSKDEIYQIIIGLAFNHQIVSQPISLPSTLYGAHELAKRAKNCRRTRIGKDTSDVSSDSGVSSNDDEITSYRLGIQGPRLSMTKFWA